MTGRSLRRDMSLSAIVAGFLSALINFAGPFLVVLEATRAAGLDEAQTASWVWALSIGNGACSIALSLFTRIPVIVAWSTPGAALLIASLGGFSFAEAVGAFLVASVAAAIVGYTGLFGWLLSRIPGPILQALLAGILLPFIVKAAGAFASAPVIAASIVVTFFVGKRFFDRFAVLAALVVGLMTTWATGSLHEMTPALTLSGPLFTMPILTPSAIVSIALPLFIVTMAAQNAPGLALLRSQGYRPDDRLLVGTISAVSAILAPFGAHGINLGAITAAIAVGPESHPDHAKRYIAGLSGGVTYLLVGSFGGILVAGFQAIPTETVSVIAAVALLGSALTALTGAMSGDTRTGLAAITTLAVTMSGVVLFSVGAAFWGLLAGTVVYLALAARGQSALHPDGRQDPATAAVDSREVRERRMQRGRRKG
ncbi:benzoate/H(+) symporter BenE family transporter [Microbacterium sp. SSW1-49]|uniref:Benzoate/H(+) symporter BenE family transporter n=1 Tax=Microbacterium croceum TaxID=2851645 RepID=A0ABT0FBG9_9MICO|nr:benzoate/H(+) symporter BenE family transporter [Microbacterium croceum]MCK2035039.1 benzoate/H(+) symporter BenE family transporter [Microbacterium croceum]